ncbi:urease accessory protein [Rhodoferax sp. OV413]|uniref:HupE/UreJ family protein n=1 Tax=Rhodoferax sp. OV413 TaxID=1855285 RepID=UPI00087F020E|nr:HupE/UreJ family protein [Rhodoferax sp. OV413]SDP44316.1 urease accessory protein [Rhodoferax sp. OV413]
MRTPSLRTIVLIASAAVSTGASAHLGTDAGVHHSFLDGLMHPLTGMDHMAAMLAVGLWSAMTARRVWLAPISFAGMLMVGALLGLGGLQLSGVEPMIAASLLVLGLLVATKAQLPSLLAAGVVGVFAVFHGIAHGTELAGGDNGWAPLVGMLVATLGLHLAGVAIGLALRSYPAWMRRVAGGLVAVVAVLPVL